MLFNLAIITVFQLKVWAQNCPAGYTLFEPTNACYRAVRSTPVTFDVAEADCESTGGMLSSITSEAEAAHIKDLTAVGGGPYELSEMTWIGMRYNGTWKYLDGATKQTGAVWGFGQPNNWYGNEYCAQMCQDSCSFFAIIMFFGKTQVLNDWPCGNTSAAYVCKNPNTPNLCSSSTSRCPDGYEYFAGTDSCFKVTTTSLPLSFSKAQSSCQIENAHLASITTEEESAFVKALAATSSPTELTQQPYIGLDNKGDDIPWFDGNPKMFFKWAETKTTRSNCFVFVVDPALNAGESLYSGATELVADVDCSQESSRFICKAPACPISSTTAAPTEATTTTAPNTGSHPCMSIPSAMTITFAMDSSSSMKSTPWKKMVSFVKSAGQFLPPSAKINFIKFSSKVTVSKALNPGWTIESFKNSVPKKFDSGASNTPSAFKKALSMLSGDTNKNKGLLIMTDGRPETQTMKLAKGREQALNAANALRAQGVQIYCAGIGPHLYADGVKAMKAWMWNMDDFFWRNATTTPFSESHMSDVLATMCSAFEEIGR